MQQYVRARVVCDRGQLGRAEPVKGQSVDWLKRFSLFRTTVRSWEFGLMLIGAQNYLQVESCLKMNFIIIRESHKFKWYWEIHIEKKISFSKAEEYDLIFFRKYVYSLNMQAKLCYQKWKRLIFENVQDEHWLRNYYNHSFPFFSSKITYLFQYWCSTTRTLMTLYIS